MLTLDDLEVSYRFSPRRRSIGLTVTAEGKLVIAAPPGTSRASLARALEKHKAWILKTAAQRKGAWDRLEPGTAFYRGKPYRLTPLTGPQDAVKLAAEEIKVTLRRKPADLWPLLQAWYIQEAQGLVQTRVHHFAARMGLSPGPVQMRDWKRRWGECHPKGELRFNWRLIMLPPEILDYVVVHELTHLRVPAHPPEFWRQVGLVLPDYAARRRYLNRYGAPFLVWRVE